MNVGSLLPRHARYRGDHTALVVGDRRMSFRELNRYVNRLANALLASGLRKGDKLTTVLPNCLELMAAFWAAGKTGIVVVPASPMLQDAGLATLIDDSDSAMVIAGAAFADDPRPDPRRSAEGGGRTGSCWSARATTAPGFGRTSR